MTHPVLPGGIRGWPLWRLPRWLIAFVAGVSAAGVAVLLLAGARARFSLHDLLISGILLGCLAVTAALTERARPDQYKDFYDVWEFPAAILLPLEFALGLLICRMAIIRLRVRRGPLHRQVFNAAAIGLSYASAALVFHTVAGRGSAATALLARNPAHWLLAVAAAAAVHWLVNIGLVYPAVKGSTPAIRLPEFFLAEERLNKDVTELCVAVVVCFALATTPVTIVFELPLVMLLARFFGHHKLISAARQDSKTGLLNAGTWEREATREVKRALRSGAPLAVALVDLDHFKAVNDAHGHLAGDEVLQAVSGLLTGLLREYDRAGRFGGEEFSLLLPQTGALDACRVAERIRSGIAGMPVYASTRPGGEPLRVTASIGVATLDPRHAGTAGMAAQPDASEAVTLLLAAADAAMYRAKQAGRNQVWAMPGECCTDTAGRRGEPVAAVPAQPGAGGAQRDGQQPAASACQQPGPRVRPIGLVRPAAGGTRPIAVNGYCGVGPGGQRALQGAGGRLPAAG